MLFPVLPALTVHMRAMVLDKIAGLERDPDPLKSAAVPEPSPREGEILVRVSACGVCHTELDEIEGRTPPEKLPVIPGHQIIGTVEQGGARTARFKTGERVGIAWIHSACGTCAFCRSGNENLCDDFKATGRDVDGGYAEYTVVPEAFAFAVPDVFSDSEAAPLLCAGAIGYRSVRLAEIQDGDTIGLAGFGASGHLMLKTIQRLYSRSRVLVFSRTEQEQSFARELGAAWAGSFEERPPAKPRAIIDTTPAWGPVVSSLRNLEKGGRLVINAIRKEDRDRDALLRTDYTRDLWMEKEIKSVANITRKDVQEFLAFAATVSLRPEIEEYRLEDANAALRGLKERTIRGAKVLKM